MTEPTPQHGASTKHRLALIEAARGIAALLVVLHHAGNMLALPRFSGVEPLGGHLRNFNVGVDFFFVLSGFIIAWVHWDDFGRRERLPHYARRRVLRVYPPYWGLLLPLLLFYLLFPSAGSPSDHDPINMLLSIPLVPYRNQPVVGVAWTLTYEIFFYLLIAAAIAVGRRSLWLAVPWAIIILALSTTRLSYPLSFLFSPFHLEFIGGVGAAALLKRYRIPRAAWLMTAGATAFLLLLLLAPHIQDVSLRGRLAFGAASVAFIVGAVGYETRHPVRVPRALGRLGAASYSLYLVHVYALSATIDLAWRAGAAALPSVMLLAIMAAIAIACGVLYHRFAEPLLTRACADAIDRIGAGRRDHRAHAVSRRPN